MALKDWEEQHALLHKHSNVKFTKPTPRGHEQPVIERHGSNPGIDLAIVVLCAIALAVSVVALKQGWL